MPPRQSKLRIGPNDDLRQGLLASGLWDGQSPLRLHLGCGEIYLEGYINVDYDSSQHSVQQNAVADVFAEVVTLNLPPSSVDEIRLHHVFEHFDRPTALALLCRWHSFLKPNGKLLIETPDLSASIELLSSNQFSYQQKQVVIRHLFGSHEAGWAVHWDGWYRDKYERVLQELGYTVQKVEQTEWLMTRNIIVHATKLRYSSLEALAAAASKILQDSCVDNSASETRLHAMWFDKFVKVLSHGPVAQVKSVPTSPVVGIFMPAYNAEKYIAETIESILNQTYRDLELVIADDGSTDRTLAIINSYAQRDPRVKAVPLPHGGEVIARNAALANVNPNARYLMNHDSDDISLPRKLEALVAHAEAHPELAIVGCLAEYFNDAGEHLGMPPLSISAKQVGESLSELNSLINSAALIRREVFNQLGGYREEFRTVEDYDLFAQAHDAGLKMENIPQTLHRIRLHPASIGSTRGALQAERAAKIQTRLKAKGCHRQGTSPESLTILHTVEFYSPAIGGAEIVVQNLSERLVKRGHHVTVATTQLNERQFFELNGVQVVGFNIAGNLVNGITGADPQRYQSYIASSRADVMMNYAAQQWATDLAFLPVSKQRQNRVNVIAPCGYSALLDARTLRHANYQGYFQELLPQVLPLYDAAVYHSAQYKDYDYAKILNLTNSVVIPNAVDEDEFQKPDSINFREHYKINKPRMLLCVANFLEGKGQDRVIQAFRELNRPDCCLVLVGREGPTRPALERMATGLDVRFIQNIPRDHTIAAFRSADLFLFGSYIEASPLVLIEAKASALPYISTDCGNAREWQGGIVCEPQLMAREAARLLDNESERKNLGQIGYREWKDRLTWSAVVSQYEQLYRTLVMRKAGNAQQVPLR